MNDSDDKKFPRMNAPLVSDSTDDKKSDENICPSCSSESFEYETIHGFKIKGKKNIERTWLQTIRTQRAVLSDCERILNRVEDIHRGAAEELFSAALCVVTDPDADAMNMNDEDYRHSYEEAVELLACSDFLGENDAGQIGVDMCGCIAVRQDDGMWIPFNEAETVAQPPQMTTRGLN